jgi:predicted lipoprotein with Yx(FWY)xxD motif
VPFAADAGALGALGGQDDAEAMMLTKNPTTMPVLKARRRTKVLVIMAMVLLALAGSAAYLYDRYVAVTRYTAEHGQVTISADTVSGLGRILATNKGYALYVFAPDAASQVTCTGDCANAWPPLVVPAGDTAAVGAGVRPGLLGTMPGPDGKRVATYHGWPLYTYLGDADPGHPAGQGLDDDGGYWYVMRPSGQIVRPQVR